MESAKTKQGGGIEGIVCFFNKELEHTFGFDVDTRTVYYGKQKTEYSD